MKLERQFSKELAPGLRKEAAEKLRQARKGPTDLSDLKREEKNKSTESFNLWPDTKNTSEELKRDIWGKIFKNEEYKKREALLGVLLHAQKEENIDAIQREYQKRFNEIIKNCPLTLEERERYLNTASMEKMSLEDYLVLLKRLSGEAFYHVTRYGVRENTFMSTGGGHEIGKGSFVDGFRPLLYDGNINSFVSTIAKDSTMKSILHFNREAIEELKSKGKSLDDIVDEFMKNYETGHFLDTESAHFSYGVDLHDMYGSEKDYKLYFYYPVEYILQNDFSYHTRESQITIGEGYMHNRGGINQASNDIEIFNFSKGVPINAGILCITGDILVDPETGSQYVIKDGKPEMDEKGEFKKPEKRISSKEYWENYFKLHPELKPNKIIYSEFGTGTYEENPDLIKWAESKNTGNKYKNRMKELEDYIESSKEMVRKIYTDAIQGEFFKE